MMRVALKASGFERCLHCGSCSCRRTNGPDKVAFLILFRCLHLLLYLDIPLNRWLFGTHSW